MKRRTFLLCLIPFLFSFTGKPRMIKADDLMKRVTATNDTTYVVNFWATWCAPCIKELPDFEKVNTNYAGKKVKVILVSMDFPEDYDTKLIPFIKKKNVLSEVVMLNETKPDIFINKINPKWQGSIPATMIINKSKDYSAFFEESLTYDFLEKKLKELGN
jgi:thiol-disulfide isomerase/thioredoxin